MHPWPFLAELAADQRCRADLRQDETITVDPVGVLWVEGHELVEEHMSDGSQAHGGARVAGIGFEGGIRLGGLVRAGGEREAYGEGADGVDAQPIVFGVRHDDELQPDDRL